MVSKLVDWFDERFDVVEDLAFLLVAGNAEVVVGLEAGPHFGAGAEVAGQAQGGVGTDAALFEHDFVDAARGDIQGAGERILGQAMRVHEFLTQNFARMDGGQFVRSHVSGSPWRLL